MNEKNDLKIIDVLVNCCNYFRTKKVPPAFYDFIVSGDKTKFNNIINENFKNGNGLYLVGKIGVGKTTFCWYLLENFIITEIKRKLEQEKKYRLLEKLRYNQTTISIIVDDECQKFSFNFWCDLAIKIKTMFDLGGEYVLREKDFYSNVKLLILDDLGDNNLNKFYFEFLNSVINYRYENKLLTIFTSDFSISEISKKVNTGIASRISSMCDIVKLDGVDHRIKIKK